MQETEIPCTPKAFREYVLQIQSQEFFARDSFEVLDDYFIHDITIGKLKKLFESEVYSKPDYNNGIRVLVNEKYILQSAIDSASLLSDSWGFKVFPQYKILR